MRAVKDEATRSTDDAAVVCEPSDDDTPENAHIEAEADDRTLEEEGYGYGV